MTGPQAVDALLNARIEIVVCRRHVGEHGVATERRDVDGAQHGAEDGGFSVAAVGMPQILEPDDDAITREREHVFDDRRQRQDLTAVRDLAGERVLDHDTP